MAEPLVSIGIPTYERAGTLEQAARSALAQTHRNLEVVICDDGSRDGTPQVCEALAAEDARVRWRRSPVNTGLAANHNLLFAELRGDYAMLLADDDRLAPDYVERCLAELRRRPELAVVCGRAVYVDPQSGQRHPGASLQLTQPDLAARVVSYVAQVDENGLLYGLMPRAVLQTAAPFRSVLGNDWLLVMGVLAQGGAVTIEETSLYRELGGTSADFPKLVRILGLPSWQARVPHVVIAWQVFAEIAFRGRAFRRLAPPARLLLGVRAGWAAIRWRSLAWHLAMPAFQALGRRPRGAPLWRAFLRVTRGLGAGRGP